MLLGPGLRDNFLPWNFSKPFMWGLVHFGGSFLVIFTGDFAPSGVRDSVFYR